jgi:CheY-like chemotaxis protein
MFTLLLIEPYPALRQSLRLWLEVALAPCAMLEADDMAHALTLTPNQAPDVILLELDELSTDDQADIWRLKQIYPKTVIVGIGIDETTAHRQRAELAGVADFVPKPQLQSDLVRVLQKVNPCNRDAKKNEIRTQYKEKQ